MHIVVAIDIILGFNLDGRVVNSTASTDFGGTSQDPFRFGTDTDVDSHGRFAVTEKPDVKVMNLVDVLETLKLLLELLHVDAFGG